MNKQNNPTFKLNPGTGIVAGIVIAAFAALLISAITGDDSVWAWAIPVGVAVGAAAGSMSKKNGGGK